MRFNAKRIFFLIIDFSSLLLTVIRFLALVRRNYRCAELAKLYIGAIHITIKSLEAHSFTRRGVSGAAPLPQRRARGGGNACPGAAPAQSFVIRRSDLYCAVFFLCLLIFINPLCAFYGLGFCLTIGVKMENENSCVLCGASVLRCRKHILTELVLEHYRAHVVMLLQEIIPREVSTSDI